MAKAAVQRTVKFISKLGTYTCYLQSSSPLWQQYSGNDPSAAGAQWIPNLSGENSIIIYFVCISSRLATGVSNPASHPTWSIAGTMLNDGGNILTDENPYRNYIELVAPSGAHTYYGLKIKGNIGALLGSSFTIAASAEMAFDGTDASDVLRAATRFDICPATSDGVHVHIYDTSDASFTFTAEEQTITMEARTYMGTERIDTNVNYSLSYQWQKVATVGGVTDWVNIGGATGKTLSVGENDIITYAQYRCVVTLNSVRHYAYADLMDATDPWIINPYPSRYNSGGVKIEEGGETIENSGEYIQYAPLIVSRETNLSPSRFDEATFDYVLTDSAGATIVNGSEVTTFKVTYAQCAAHGNIGVNIQSHEDLEDY